MLTIIYKMLTTLNNLLTVVYNLKSLKYFSCSGRIYPPCVFRAINRTATVGFG